MIVDSSALLAFFDLNEPSHEAVAAILQVASEPLVVSPFVIAELDYLVLDRYGRHAEEAMLSELVSGAWTLATPSINELRHVRDLVLRYADVPIGVTDAMNIVLADKHRTRTIATLDRRHFSILRFADGTAPILVP